MKLSYLDSKLEIKSIEETKNQEGNFGVFTCYASITGNIDEGGDVVDKGAFKKTLSERRTLPLLWHHIMPEPLGIATSLKEDINGLFYEGQINLDTTIGREKWSLIKQFKAAGHAMGSSIGYQTIKDVIDEGIRHIKELRLWEVSLTPFPMNPLATVVNIKSVVPFQDLPLAEMGMMWDSAKAEKRVRAWAGAEDAPNEDYKKAFVWFDSENPEIFQSYKLPIADVIDEKLMAIPKACFAAAGAIQGARTRIKIPEAEIPRVKNHIARYYKKMDRMPPWEESASIDESVISFCAFVEQEGIKIDSIKALYEKTVGPSCNPDTQQKELRAAIELAKSFRIVKG